MEPRLHASKQKMNLAQEPGRMSSHLDQSWVALLRTSFSFLLYGLCAFDVFLPKRLSSIVSPVFVPFRSVPVVKLANCHTYICLSPSCLVSWFDFHSYLDVERIGGMNHAPSLCARRYLEFFRLFGGNDAFEESSSSIQDFLYNFFGYPMSFGTTCFFPILGPPRQHEGLPAPVAFVFGIMEASAHQDIVIVDFGHKTRHFFLFLYCCFVVVLIVLVAVVAVAVAVLVCMALHHGACLSFKRGGVVGRLCTIL